MYGGCDDEEERELLDEEPERFIRLPSKYEIHEYSIMEEFVESLPEGTMQNQLAHAIQRRGAFRRFKDAVNRMGFAYMDNSIKASVDGSDIYDVEISLDGEEVLDMYCSCPYAADRAEVVELISQIPENKVRELLVGFVMADEGLKNKLIMQYAFKMNSKLMLELRTELEQIERNILAI